VWQLGHNFFALSVQPLFSAFTQLRLGWKIDEGRRDRRCQMRLTKVAKTILSVMAVASSIIVVSWVGLALLGY
jgi:hypothetical protein